MLLALALAIGGCAGSGSHKPNHAELRIERHQLMLVAHDLRMLRAAVRHEVTAARAAWPMLAHGLPRSIAPSLSRSIAAASAAAERLPTPSFMARPNSLTGPAAGVGGLYETFARLAERAWRLTEAAARTSGGAPVLARPQLSSGPRSPAARFARANSPLYLDAIYDAHFDLSLVGRSLLEGYRRLGGARTFGSSLTQTEVEALAKAYSIAAVRLLPHPGASIESP
jgi:hypothetical protein